MDKIKEQMKTASENDDDIVIRLKSISKKFKLYSNRQDRLKEALHPMRKQYYREFWALRHIDLEIRRGEIVGIVGKNGSGKSTLLKIVSRILTPTSGTVDVKGKIVPLIELGAGFNPEFTGLENIYFYCALLGYTRPEIDQFLDEIIEFSELGHFIDQPIKTYSSGMAARLAFSVSIIVDPDILILDEVLSVGDDLFKRKCFAKMEYFFEAGKTILFVSHSVNSVNQLCNRSILLDKGELILEGPTRLVTSSYQNYLFVKNEEQDKIRKEILQLNRDQNLKASIFENLDIAQDDADPLEDESPPDMIPTVVHSKGETAQNPYFIPDFVPTTRTVTRNCDIDITDVEIRTLDNETVNALIMREEYILTYHLKFDVDIKKVVSGYLIKNEKGLFINNGNTRSEPLAIVKTGDRYRVDWRFSCLLMPGNYYVNVSVSTLDNKAQNAVLSRISDAIVFKVLSDVAVTTSGIVTLNQEATIARINSNQP